MKKEKQEAPGLKSLKEALGEEEVYTTQDIIEEFKLFHQKNKEVNKDLDLDMALEMYSFREIANTRNKISAIIKCIQGISQDTIELGKQAHSH